VSAETQLLMLLKVRVLHERATRWLLRNRPRPIDIAAATSRYAPTVAALVASAGDVVCAADRTAARSVARRLVEAGVPGMPAERAPRPCRQRAAKLGQRPRRPAARGVERAERGRARAVRAGARRRESRSGVRPRDALRRGARAAQPHRGDRPLGWAAARSRPRLERLLGRGPCADRPRGVGSPALRRIVQHPGKGGRWRSSRFPRATTPSAR